MTGVVFCTQGRAYKVARGEHNRHVFGEEADFLRDASTVPWVRERIAPLERFDERNLVLVKECLEPVGRTSESKLFDLHREMERRMLPHGWTAPEFKADSYVTTREGPKLVDAGFAHRVGENLLRYTRDIMARRRQPGEHERPSDMAFSIRMEKGRTLTEKQADPVLAKLAVLEAAGNVWQPQAVRAHERSPMSTTKHIEEVRESLLHMLESMRMYPVALVLRDNLLTAIGRDAGVDMDEFRALQRKLYEADQKGLPEREMDEIARDIGDGLRKMERQVENASSSQVLNYEREMFRPGASASESTAKDYVAVSSAGKVVLGPTKDYEAAKREAGKHGGVVRYVMGEAREVVPVAYEARDAGAFATVERDTKLVDKARALGEVSDARKVYDLLEAQYAKESQEVFLCLPVDLRGQLLCPPVEIARGQRDRVSIDVSDVLRPVIATNAQGFVVTHGHPSGHATPSAADKSLTKHIKESAKIALPEVMFIDHVVIGRREYYSFTEGRLFKVKG